MDFHHNYVILTNACNMSYSDYAFNQVNCDIYHGSLLAAVQSSKQF